MEKVSFILISIIGAMALSSCGSSSSNNGNTGTVACANGTYVAGGSVCTANTGSLVSTTSTRVGYFTQSSNYPLPAADGAGTSMTLGSGFQTILQNAMGVCNRQAYSGGLASCPAWQEGYQDLVIIMDSTNATQAEIVVRSYPYINPNNAYSYSFPSVSQFFAGLLDLSSSNDAPVYDPLVLSTTVWPINNSKGFELRANGPTQSNAWWSLIQFQVLNGQVGDSQISYTMYIDGGNQQMLNAISGTMNICQTENCGIPGL